MKTCKKCGRTKPIGEFYKHTPSKDGRDYWCRSCKKEATSKWIKAHPEVNREKALRWQRKMKEQKRCVVCGQKAVNNWFCQKHREYHNKKHREYYLKKMELEENVNKNAD